MGTVELKTENKCKHCDAVFHNLAILKKHLKKNHGEMATFKCDICPKMYFSARGLRSHQEIHKEVQTNETGEKDQREDDYNRNNCIAALLYYWIIVLRNDWIIRCINRQSNYRKNC